MSIASALGLDKIGDQSVKEARAAMAETVQKVDPLISHIINGLGWMIHSVLNRFTCSVHFEIKPLSKSEFENPTPME